MKKQSELRLIARACFKQNGYVLYRLSSGEKLYNVSVVRGRVTSCCQTNGESCQGFKYQHKCRHAEYVSQLEQERSPVAANVQEAAGIRDALRPSEKGVLNGGPKAFSIL